MDFLKTQITYNKLTFDNIKNLLFENASPTEVSETIILLSTNLLWFLCHTVRKSIKKRLFADIIRKNKVYKIYTCIIEMHKNTVT